MKEVTQILQAICAGQRHAAERLLPLVYEELRELAAAKLRHEPAGHTLNATALVHYAYLRLVGPADREPQTWDGRGHFSPRRRKRCGGFGSRTPDARSGCAMAAV